MDVLKSVHTARKQQHTGVCVCSVSSFFRLAQEMDTLQDVVVA